MDDKSAFRQYVAENAGKLAPISDPIPPVIPSGIPHPVPQQTDTLPDFKRMSDIQQGHLELPEILVDDLLHRGCKMVIAGGSKSFKSWSLIDLGIAVSEGGHWWGHKCKVGRVLYLNFELIDGFFEQRLLTVSSARNATLNENFLYWNLRGKSYDLVQLSRVVEARSHALGQIDLIIVDPVYKALGDLDENSAGDMSLLMQKIEALSDSVGASVVFGAHFSKGNQAGKESMDRISGSGVFARDPDVILTMTGHQDKGSYIVESELRYLPPIPEFVVSWKFPLMVPDESKDPRDFYDPNKKQAQKEADATAPFTDNDVLDCLPYSGLNDPAWRTNLLNKFGQSGRPFYQAKSRLLEEGKVKKEGNRYYRVNLELNSDQ